MITLCERVRDALGSGAVFGWPKDIGGGDTRLMWRESMNRCWARADGQEHLAEVKYTVDVFAPAMEAALERAQAADTALRAEGLSREDLHMQNEERLAHIIVRYRALADADGNVYQ